MTPLIYLTSIVVSAAIRVAPLPGKPIRRMLVVAMRADLLKTTCDEPLVVLGAARLGNTRLIDNMEV